MSFLAKAPRGLLFIYPLLFLLGYWQFLQLFRSKIIQVGIILICLLWNAWQINEHIYQYADSNYKQVATTLKSSGINTIKTSAALGITPFVFSNTAVEVVFHADSLKPTDQYFLKDDCWKIAKIGAFDKIEGKSLKKWKEPSLCSPFLYLESCEYNNNTYGEALRDWENAKMQEYHLELIDLQ